MLQGKVLLFLLEFGAACSCQENFQGENWINLYIAGKHVVVLIFHFIAEWIANGKNSGWFQGIGNVFMLWDIFKPTFFYIEEEDILLGIGKEGVEMVFKQDCNQTIWLRFKVWKVFGGRDKTITIVLWSFRTRGLKSAENIIHVYKTVLTKTNWNLYHWIINRNISVNHSFMLTCFNICSSDFPGRSKVNSDEFSLKYCETISANTKGINCSWNLIIQKF